MIRPSGPWLELGMVNRLQRSAGVEEPVPGAIRAHHLAKTSFQLVFVAKALLAGQVPLPTCRQQ